MTNGRDLQLFGGPPERLEGSVQFGVWIAPETHFGERLRSAGLAHGNVALPLRFYPKGALVYRQGDPADGFYVVLSGGVKLVAPESERVLAVCGPNDVFGAEASAQVRRHRSEAVSVAVETQVISVSDEAFREATRRDPELACIFANVFAQRVQVLEDEVARAQLPVQARLARTLLSLAGRFGTELAPGLVELELDIRQNDIASLAGARRVSATRALSAWRELGLVRGTRGSYRINMRGLTELSELLEEEHAG